MPKRNCKSFQSFSCLRFRGLYIITARSCFINHQVKYQDNAWMDSAKEFNAFNHASSSFVSLGHSINLEIQKQIGWTYTAPAILSTIEKNHSQIVHASIYGKAMKKCDSLRDFDAVHNIMDLMLSSSNSSVSPTEIEFNIFLNSMARGDRPQIAAKYYNLMTRRYSLTPDLVTFSAMIRSCRYQHRIDDAESYWTAITMDYRLQPNEYHYGAMIAAYSMALQTDKAVALFHEYLDGVHRGYVRCNIGPFSAYLNVFCRIGDIEGMKGAMNRIKQNGFKLTKFLVSDIMRGYVEGNRGDKALQILNQWQSEGNVPSQKMLTLKCGVLIRKMRGQKGPSDSTSKSLSIGIIPFDEKYKIYKEVEKTIYGEMKGLDMDLSRMGKVHLDAVIALYSDRDPMQIVKVFEKLLEHKMIGYLGANSNNNLGSKTIDLHLFSVVQAQFIIRYVFAFKLKEVMDDQMQLCIVVGKGNHSKHGQRSLKDSVIKELSSWNPPVHCTHDECNTGILFVDKESVRPFVEASISATDVFMKFQR